MAERLPGQHAPPVVRAESTPLREPGDVVRRAAAGDARAFEQLYKENLGRVYALCLRMTRDRSRAEELTQEAFVRAWEKLNSFRGDSVAALPRPRLSYFAPLALLPFFKMEFLNRLSFVLCLCRSLNWRAGASLWTLTAICAPL